MFSVKLYTFSKKPNSTKRPSDSGTNVNIVLKSPTSFLNPVLELDFGNNNPTTYNYCYIPTFNRYYFIENWTYAGRLWLASCKVDVLASFKTALSSKSFMVLRSASEYDLNVIDTMYPAKAELKRIRTFIGYDNVKLSFPSDSTSQGLIKGTHIDGATMLDGHLKLAPDNGFYVLGVDGNPGANSSPGLNYFVLLPADIPKVTSVIYPNLTQSTLSVLDTIENVAAMMLVNPGQYIKSIMHFPMDLRPYATYSSSNMFTGYWDTRLEGYRLNSLVWENSFNIAPRAPSTLSNRGKWACMPPYCQVSCYCPFFGKFNLPMEYVANEYNFKIAITVSLVTGEGVLKVIPYKDTAPSSYDDPILILNAKVGEEGYMTAIGGGNVGGALINGVMGNFRTPNGESSTTTNKPSRTQTTSELVTDASTSRDFVDNVTDTIQVKNSLSYEPIALPAFATGAIEGTKAIFGSDRSIGTPSGTTETIDLFYILTEYFEPVDDDNADMGKPLCKRKTLSSLSGFVQVLDGNVSTDGTQFENEVIRKYLEGGFFYE